MHIEILKAIYQSAFSQQKAFIKDPSTRKALFVPRRGAKTYTIAIYILLAALTHPNVKIVYLGLSKESAENGLWKDGLLKIFNDFAFEEGKDYKYNRSRRIVELANGSTIRMTGADTSFKEPAKLLGGKYFMAIIDECQNYTTDLANIILTVLGPAVSDYLTDGGGQIILAGTAGPYMGEHYWYKINTSNLGWSIHSWKGTDNPFMVAAKLIEEQKFLQDFGPNYIQLEWYRQQYLCAWIIDTENRIYKYDPNSNALTNPTLIKSLLSKESKWNYIIGMDFGYEDDNALVVGAFYKHDPVCYIVDSFKKNHMQIDELADLIQKWKDKYKPIHIVGDAQNKIVIESLRQRYRIPIVAAKKLGKFSHTVDMNSDFKLARIQVIAANNAALIDEWSNCSWHQGKRAQGEFVETASNSNHLADAALYLHHFSKHYRATPEPVITEQDARMTIAENRLKKTLPEHRYDIFDQMEISEFVADYKRGII